MYELQNGEQYTIRIIDGVVTLDHWKAGLLKPVRTTHKTPEKAFLVFSGKLDTVEVTELVRYRGVQLIPKL